VRPPPRPGRGRPGAGAASLSDSGRGRARGWPGAASARTAGLPVPPTPLSAAAARAAAGRTNDSSLRTSGIPTPRITFGILGYVRISLGYPFFKTYPWDIPNSSHFCIFQIEISLTYLCCFKDKYYQFGPGMTQDIPGKSFNAQSISFSTANGRS
jgi:hypothetical protein